MKIIRLSTFLDFGGIESKMVNLSSFEDTENEWVFVAINKGGVAEKKIRANHKRVVCLNLPYRIPSFKTIIKLYKFFRKEKPDVIHTSGAEANFFGFLAGKLAKVPTIIVEEIGIPNATTRSRKIFGMIFKNADWAIGESKIVVDFLTDTYKLNISKTKVVHNFGLFNYDFSNLEFKKKDDVFKIITISRLEPVKNIEGIIRVLSHLIKAKKRVELTIAGSGVSENNLKELVSQLDLNDNVHFAGFITDPYPYLQNSDLYILNSFTEGFSNSLVEAMYSKTLCLSTNVGAAPEIIRDFENGFMVPVDDEKALYNKIKDIIALSDDQRKSIRESGHQTVVDNFSLENHISELMKYYNYNA